MRKDDWYHETLIELGPILCYEAKEIYSVELLS